jgi:hypothetical protein
MIDEFLGRKLLAQDVGYWHFGRAFAISVYRFPKGYCFALMIAKEELVEWARPKEMALLPHLGPVLTANTLSHILLQIKTAKQMIRMTISPGVMV